jgi:subtilase family serine protease
MASRTLSARAWALWLAVAVAAAAALAMPLAAQRAAATVRPHPFAAGHVSVESLPFPPDTNWCLANRHISCYQPAQFQKHYNLGPLFEDGLNGAGRTIVIVDSFGSPTVQHDLAVFDQTFNLPAADLTVAAPAGPIPTFDPTNGDHVGWAQETSLDVEMAHLMAPGAKLLLLETPIAETEGVQGFPEMVAAENWAINHNLGDVISQSFGATEETFPGAIHHNAAILGLRSAFKNAARHNVTVLGSSGDLGSTDALFDTNCCYPFQVNSWPSSDPLVTSIGGTQLHMNNAGDTLAPDNTWNEPNRQIATGGGLSKVFDRPAFQNHVRSLVGSKRGTPDISMSASVDGGAVVYYSFVGDGWHVFGGTSEASPLFSGIVAIADQIAGERIGNFNQRLYNLGRHHAPGIVDVTLGNNTETFTNAAGVDITVPGFNALPGYDLATGWGTVDAAKLCRQLAGEDNTGDNGGNN